MRPVVSGESAFPPAARTPVTAEPGSPIRLLLVEDHEDSAAALSYVLRHQGYEVRVAHSVAEGIACADATLDLIVSDLGLPDGSGLDLMRQLTARMPIKGIALTGSGRAEDRAKILAAGFQRHLVKPVDIATLIAAIAEVHAQPKGD